MSTIEPDSAAVTPRRAVINPFEVVLGVVAVVFVGVGLFGVQWAARQQSLANNGYYCDADGNCTERYDFVLTQVIYMLAPAVVAAGLIALVIALALRALALNALRVSVLTAASSAAAAERWEAAIERGLHAARTPDASAAAQTPSIAPTDDSTRFDLPRRTARARAFDHSAFMRPRGAGDSPAAD
jgi:hypothetical protein